MQAKDWAAIAAVIVAAIALERNRRSAVATSWNLALQRLGQLYDAAMNDQSLASIILETSSSTPQKVVTFKQDVWLGNLFMALEQVFVASQTLRRKAREPWERYILNQFEKPTIGHHFRQDLTVRGDYHGGFVELLERKNLVGPPARPPVRPIAPPKTLHISKLDLQGEEMEFWRELYRDPDVARQMYAVPIDDEEALRESFAEGAFVVWEGNRRVGGFTITREKQHRGTFGIVIHKEYRGQGYGLRVIKELVEPKAWEMGLMTLRADVYLDNIASRRLLDRAGYREFVWVEKNIERGSP